MLTLSQSPHSNARRIALRLTDEDLPDWLTFVMRRSTASVRLRNGRYVVSLGEQIMRDRVQ
ncbi:protein of unknown function [Hyphomicrobium sp. MC1]|nr:protein of unknown function [Hyphomicrobium sp. MC1]